MCGKFYKIERGNKKNFRERERGERGKYSNKEEVRAREFVTRWKGEFKYSMQKCVYVCACKETEICFTQKFNGIME